MSYITPDSTIYLLKDVPLDPTYDHSIYWSSSDDRDEYFIGKAHRTLTEYSYQRVNKGVLRCGVLADNLYGCNYMMFQNTAYGSHWFYAFVTKIEWVNNVTSEVFYEIDPLQTWFFRIHFGQCWIERQHTTTDYIGEHVEPEPLDCVEYGYVNQPKALGLNEMVCIVAICDVDGAADVQLYGRNISGCQLYAYALSSGSKGISGINDLIDSYSEAPDSIVAMYLAPANGILEADIGSGSPISVGGTVSSDTSFSALSASSVLGWNKCDIPTHTPRNCKLYTYPYTYFSVTDANGGSMVLPYEWFYNGKPVIGYASTVTQPAEAICFPMKYKGSGNGTVVSGYGSGGNSARYYPEALTLTDYPMCSWNYDAYKVWIAQNATPIKNTMRGTLATTLIGAAAGITSGNPVAMVGSVSTVASNLVSTLTSIANQKYYASIAADVSSGSFTNGGVNSALYQKDFYTGRMSIDGYTAARYDQFFDMFGYALNKHQTPNLCAREYWTYIKTSTCVLAESEGGIPADDQAKICAIMNTGITFWNGKHTGSILDYSSPSKNQASSRGYSSDRS